MSAGARVFLQPWVRLGIVFVFALIGMIWQRVEARRQGKQVLELRQNVDRLRYENGKMQTQIHQWTAPSHLEALAKEKYKLLPPTPEQRVTVDR